MDSSNSTGKDLCRQFSGGNGGGSGRGVGPAKGSSGGANEAVLGNICSRDNVSSYSQKNGAENFAKCTNLQAFDSCSSIPYKSPGFEMMTNLGLAFTNEQWKELERQAMIYKYMTSSVPVPYHLLFPVSNNFSHNSSVSLIYNGLPSKNGDLEPGRCKRTDGKKWRCSRDVAPHQKYCERHLHRGRPRSRKPVEVKNEKGENHLNKKTRLDQSGPSLPKAQSDANASQQFVTANNEPLMLFDAKTDLRISTPYPKGNDRNLASVMENETLEKEGVEQRWKHLMEPNIGLLTNDAFSSYTHVYDEDYTGQLPPNIFSYPNFPTPEIEAPIGFIDAWSIDNPNTRKDGINPELNDDNLSPSLDLSMAMAYRDDSNKSKDPIWSGPFSCEPFARGGPLGEALHAIGSNPGSPPHNSMGTNVSSPRTLFSHSDGSVCNSPTTFGAPPSEVSIQWFN
ncbi:hypothetical protein CASFOL_006997 [Castilleja foliolosa]|uniref:Growth-regulating factor n=1 Tax=Castilleja foliolosa TaxID=1961234 RepID=A0ABD3E8W4_9LAMI